VYRARELVRAGLRLVSPAMKGNIVASNKNTYKGRRRKARVKGLKSVRNKEAATVKPLNALPSKELPHKVTTMKPTRRIDDTKRWKSKGGLKINMGNGNAGGINIDTIVLEQDLQLPNDDSTSITSITTASSGVAVKNDVFLPSDDSEHSGSDDYSDASRKKEFRGCPSCHQKVNLTGSDYHSHLFSCLVKKQAKLPSPPQRQHCLVEESKMKSKKMKINPKQQLSVGGDKYLLDNLKSMISKLDLTFRINTMESLRRMAKNTDSTSLMFPQLNNEEVDNKVLSLVYGLPQQNAVILKTAKLADVKSNIQVTKKRRRYGAEKLVIPSKRSRRVSTKLGNLVKVANHTPPASAARDFSRRFNPVALGDLFLLPPHARVPKSSESSEWERHILSWQESSRSALHSHPMPLSQHPFA